VTKRRTKREFVGPAHQAWPVEKCAQGSLTIATDVKPANWEFDTSNVNRVILQASHHHLDLDISIVGEGQADGEAVWKAIDKMKIKHLYIPDKGVLIEIGKAPEGCPQPPAVAEFLFSIFGPRDRIETMLGDLNELFEIDVAKRGYRRANLLFWSRTVRSLLPLAVAKLRKWGILAAVIELGRRKIGW
jgi:hypothetical protein